MNKIIMLSFAVLFALGSYALAAPVDIPTQGQGLKSEIYRSEELGIALSLGSEFEYIDKRKLSKYSGELGAEILSGKIILSLDEGNFDFYGIFGQARNIKYKETVNNEVWEAELENKFMWGLGLSVYADVDYIGEDTIVFFDAKYRTARNVGFEAVTASGKRYTEKDLKDLAGVSGSANAKWEEWHLAAGLGKKLDFYMPYIGIRYSDIRTQTELKIDSVGTFTGETVKSKNKVGMFLGCAITPTDRFSIDLQGRIIDEQAFSVKGTFKF
jgi:hypothetical protein